MPEYFAERVKDVYDIEKRLLRNLIGEKRQSLSHLTKDMIVLAHDLTPSQTAEHGPRAHLRPGHGRRRPDQPHRHRRPGAGHPGRGGPERRHGRRRRRRPGHHRRQPRAGRHRPRRADAPAGPPAGRRSRSSSSTSSTPCKTCPRSPTTATRSRCWATSSFPARSRPSWKRAARASACTARSSSTSASDSEPTEEDHYQAYRKVIEHVPRAGRSSSARWTSGPTSTPRPAPACRSATRSWAAGRSACASRTCRCSRPSSARSSAPASTRR